MLDKSEDGLSVSTTRCCPQMVEQKQLKYSYKFSLRAEKTGEPTEEAGKEELQSFINELLGLDSKRTEKNRLPS